MSDLHHEIEQQYASDRGNAFYRTVMGDGGFDIHYGLYGDPTRSMRDATRASTKRLIELVQSARPSQEIHAIVDLGSGRGGPSHELARAFDARVTCVDLCPSHHQQNLQRAKDLGVLDQIRVWAGSYEALPADWTDTFDLAWSQETFCHAFDIQLALCEAARVLRPGGVIVFSDIMLSESATASQASLFSNVNAINRLATPTEYLSFIEAAGFKQPRFEDWSDHLEENFKRMLDQIEQHRSELLGQGVDEEYLARFSESLRSRIALAKDNVLRWGAFVATDYVENRMDFA